MNNRGNLMINLLFFVMALGIMIILTAPIKGFIDIAQGSNFLNCPGYIDSNARPSQNYSYNSSISSSNLACLATNLYLVYIFLVFLIAGVSKLLYERGVSFLGSNNEGGA